MRAQAKILALSLRVGSSGDLQEPLAYGCMHLLADMFLEQTCWRLVLLVDSCAYQYCLAPGYSYLMQVRRPDALQ